jgi:hypothetical protein
MRGTYRMQTGATTDLTYLYTLPQRFIIEGWFKPEFAYNTGSNYLIFGNPGLVRTVLYYSQSDDKISFFTAPGTEIKTTAFTSDAELQKWIYVRCYFDNSAKLKGFYCTVNGVVYADSQNVPGAGDFIPLNTISFLPTVAAESSYWIIHELDETLATGEYKTYQADRQVIFDFNGTTLGRERIRIPTVHGSTDTRGVASFNLSKSVENPMTGSAGANTAGLRLLNVNGSFSDDQYDAFDPFQGRYNGTQKYLQNRVQVEIETHAPATISTYDYQGYCEPLFIGRTTPGAFARNSPNKFYGDVSIKCEDGISELGETKLRKAYGFATYDLCDPAAEGDSLVHSIARLVTQKEIRNYALNSSFENATIGNSWLNSGLTTFERSSTYAQFGTYSMKCIADAISDYAYQFVTFTGNDKIDVGDIFNFSVYIRQGTASTVLVFIREYQDTTQLANQSASASFTTIDQFVKTNISHTVVSSSCNRLRIAIVALGASTFYVDGVMLTRGIDPIDYFLVNANDGAAGVGSADSAATTTYDTVAFDADAVNVEHPYALVEKGQTAWDALKKIGDASIASYIGMSPDGVMQFKVRYNGDDMPNMGDIEDFGGIGTSLDVAGANSIKVHGVIINGGAGSGSTPTKQIWSGEASGIFQTDDGNKILHPIADASYMSVSGATEIELKYSEDI